MLLKTSPVPLYHQLAELLLRDIAAGRYPEGARVPSENQLAQRHGIGRPTVRQALDSLVRRGVLLRRRGSGTFVAPRPEAVNLFSLAGTMASFSGAGLAPEVDILEAPRQRDVPAGPGNPFAGGRALQLCRLSRVEGAPVLVEDMYLHPELFAGLEGEDLGGCSLSRVVLERYGLTLAGGQQRFSIAWPDQRLAELLAWPRTRPILAVSRLLHFHQARAAVYAELYCRTDRFVFTQTLGGLADV